MNLIGFSGHPGAGKTSLLTGVLKLLRVRGLRVSTIKRARPGFDVDHAGKDSWRHREAGAFEVVVASSHRLALMREFEQSAQLSVHHLVAELYPGVDWVLVEGYRHSDVPRIEVWRPGQDHPTDYPTDPFIVAVATTAPQELPQPTALPVLDTGQPAAVLAWILGQGDRFEYLPERYAP